MTREEAKQLLPIIQAFVEGKTIEYYDYSNDDWIETSTPVWQVDVKYRIKPEPKYRPFKSQEEYLGEMLKHQPFGWVVNKKSTIMHNICGIGLNYIYVDDMTTSFIDAFAKYNFSDGTPFGIKEEL